MRDTGRSMKDRAMFEVDLVSGSIRWMNDFALEKMGYGRDHVGDLSVFDLAPQQFHDQVREAVAEKASGRGKDYSIWPGRTSSGKLAWWYVYQARTSGTKSVHWACAEYIQETEDQGPGFSFMRVQMETLRNQASIDERLEDLDRWVKEEIDRIDEEVGDIRTALASVESKAAAAERSARQAANTSLALQGEVRTYFKKFEDAQAEHAAEILKLISTDSLHDQRMAAYEKHVKEITDVAIKSISSQTDKAGRGLSRRVTIPVSVIAAVATIIQWMIQNWDKVKAAVP